MVECILKIDDELQLVVGVALVAGEVDSQGDIVDERELTKAAMRSLGAMVKIDHAGAAVGRVVQSLALTPDVAEALGLTLPEDRAAWIVGLQVEDAAVWKRIKSGEIGSGLSIGGRGNRSIAA
jgi:hypothetical protein